MADANERSNPGRHCQLAIDVALVDTSPVGAKGSMSRYCDIVEQAFSEECEGVTVRVARINLASRPLMLSCVPARARNWLHHTCVARSAAKRLRRMTPDVFHIADGSHAYIQRWLTDAPVVATAHDVIPLLQSMGSLGPRPGAAAQWLINKSIDGLRRVDHIAADSQSTAGDLCRHAGIDASGVTVVHPAVLPKALSKGTLGRTPPWSERRDARDAYVLHVGNNAFYKNRLGVLRVFKRVSAQCCVRLQMAGPEPVTELTEAVHRLGLAEQVRFVVDPDDSTLAALYSGACLFVFPSLYEGFGWPPLEAMAYGCPVVCSSAASLPEVVGDAALQCAAEDEEGMARLCLDVLGDPSLAQRLVERGRARAEHFSLEHMASALLGVYQTVLSR